MTRKLLRVCLVSSYLPRRCGIAAYTAALARGLRDASAHADVVVLSEHGSLDGHDGVVRSIPTFHRTEDYALAVAARATALGADVVHVQHSSDILGVDGRLPRLLSILQRRGIRSVVTFHTVHSPLTALLERNRGTVRFQRLVGRLADAVVVHGHVALGDELLRQGVEPFKITVIPHGTDVVSSPTRDEARRLLRLDGEGPILLYFGFVHPQKHVHTALLAMRGLSRLVPGARLFIAGSVQNPTAVNRAYAEALSWLAGAPSLRGSVRVKLGFAPPGESRLLYRAADLVVLPYREGYGSASGVAHQAVGAGCLPLCSTSPKFAELVRRIGPEIAVSSYRPGAWAAAAARLLGDGALKERIHERLERYARETSWPSVGARHLSLYRSLGAGGESPFGARVEAAVLAGISPPGPPHEAAHLWLHARN